MRLYRRACVPRKDRCVIEETLDTWVSTECPARDRSDWAVYSLDTHAKNSAHFFFHVSALMIAFKSAYSVNVEVKGNWYTLRGGNSVKIVFCLPF